MCWNRTGDDAFADAIAIAVSFTGLLDRLEIPYLVGGSVASSVHGEPRSTNDIDIVADISQDDLDAFIEQRKAHIFDLIYGGLKPRASEAV